MLSSLCLVLSSEYPATHQAPSPMPIQRFEDIEAWQLARQLCRRIHASSSSGSFAKDFALRDQISRASGSVMDNIAEGFDGGSNAEFARFLSYAQRSCTEVQSQLYRALDSNHIDHSLFDQLYGETALIHSKIGAFIKYLKQHPGKGS